jgi:hypothetical protein
VTSVFFSEIAIAVCGEHVGTAIDGSVCTGFSGAYASQDSWGACMHCNIGMIALYRLERQELNPHCGFKLGFMEGFGELSTPTPTQQHITALEQLVGAPSESLPTWDRTQLLAKKNQEGTNSLFQHI